MVPVSCGPLEAALARLRALAGLSVRDCLTNYLARDVRRCACCIPLSILRRNASLLVGTTATAASTVGSVAWGVVAGVPADAGVGAIVPLGGAGQASGNCCGG